MGIMQLLYSMSQKSVTLTISENIPKPQNKCWMLCSDAWENLHKTHRCLGQGLGVSVQLEKFQNLCGGFGIFSETVLEWHFFGDILYKKNWWVKYISKEIMALRVGPIPQKCNVSNHGIAHNCCWQHPCYPNGSKHWECMYLYQAFF